MDCTEESKVEHAVSGKGLVDDQGSTYHGKLG